MIALTSCAASYLAISAAGAAYSVRRGRGARFAGIRFPGSPRQHAWTIGTPLSAPPIMLAALMAAAVIGAERLIRVLCVAAIVGVLGEVDTRTTFAHPRAEPAGASIAALLVLVPIVMLAVAA